MIQTCNVRLLPSLNYYFPTLQNCCFLEVFQYIKARTPRVVTELLFTPNLSHRQQLSWGMQLADESFCRHISHHWSIIMHAIDAISFFTITEPGWCNIFVSRRKSLWNCWLLAALDRVPSSPLSPCSQRDVQHRSISNGVQGERDLQGPQGLLPDLR